MSFFPGKSAEQGRLADSLRRVAQETHDFEQRPLAALIDDDIALWDGLYRAAGRLDALIEYGLRWLRAHRPDAAGPVSIVRDDAGPGNFMFDGGRVSALLDGELAHLGDPLEDLAGLSMRAAPAPFPDFVAALREYGRATGRPVDLARVRFHRVLVQWRIATIRRTCIDNNSLIAWTMDDGAPAWGEDQDIWPLPPWREHIKPVGAASRRV